MGFVPEWLETVANAQPLSIAGQAIATGVTSGLSGLADQNPNSDAAKTLRDAKARNQARLDQSLKDAPMVIGSELVIIGGIATGGAIGDLLSKKNKPKGPAGVWSGIRGFIRRLFGKE